MRIDLTEDSKMSFDAICAGLGVPKTFIIGDVNYSASNLSIRYYEAYIERCRVRMLAVMHPRLPKRKPYRMTVSKNAKRAYAARLQRHATAVRLTRIMRRS